MRNRGAVAWVLSGLFFIFYILLYFDHDIFGRAVMNDLVRTVWPAGSKWNLYGLLYTLSSRHGKSSPGPERC